MPSNLVRLGALLLLAMSFASAWAQIRRNRTRTNPPTPTLVRVPLTKRPTGILPNPWTKYGVKFAATYIGEVLGNVSDGLKQGAIYEGCLNLALDLDLQKLLGLHQLALHANMFRIHGDGLSRENLQNF